MINTNVYIQARYVYTSYEKAYEKLLWVALCYGARFLVRLKKSSHQNMHSCLDKLIILWIFNVLRKFYTAANWIL